MRRTTQNPGHLAHRVELQQKAKTSDGIGGDQVTWSTLAFLWARVTPTSQSGGETADHLKGRITHELLIRHRDGVMVGMRFLYRARPLRILSCTDFTGQGRFLVCLCEEEK